MTQLEEKRQPAPRQRGSGGSRSGGGGGGSPRNLKPVKEDPSPISTSAQHKAVRSQDVLDALIDRLSIFGVLGVLVGITATAIGIMGQPGDWNTTICSLLMGMGKGGCAGFSTFAAAAFALSASPGLVNRSMALVSPITFISDVVVGVFYMRDARWDIAAKITLFAGLGNCVGMYVNQFLDDDSVRRAVGVILLVVVVLDFVAKRLVQGEKLKQHMTSTWFLMIVGCVGGCFSYVANSMGPLLNVYFVALGLSKYELVATRSASFILINAIKVGMRSWRGDLDLEAGWYGVKLGGVAVMGVVLAKIWLLKASPRFFDLVYRRVTITVVVGSGLLLSTGLSWKKLIEMLVAAGKGVWGMVSSPFSVFGGAFPFTLGLDFDGIDFGSLNVLLGVGGI